MKQISARQFLNEILTEKVEEYQVRSQPDRQTESLLALVIVCQVVAQYVLPARAVLSVLPGYLTTLTHGRHEAAKLLPWSMFLCRQCARIATGQFYGTDKHYREFAIYDDNEQAGLSHAFLNAISWLREKAKEALAS